MAEPYPTIEFEASPNQADDSKELYDFLVTSIRSSQHRNRFDIRPFTLDPTNGYESPMSVDRPYCEPIETSPEHREYIANTAAALVMPRADHDSLIEAMGLTYERPDVQAHLKKGGSIKWEDSHFTYVGQVVQQFTSWQALRQMGVQEPERDIVTLVSRLVSLFKLGIIPAVYDLKEDKGDAGAIPHHGGMILEDILLRFGGALQTIPNSATGNLMIDKLKDGKIMRSAANTKTKSAYEQLINMGGRILFEGPSGTENKVNDAETYRRIEVVKDGTIGLTINYNQTAGAERIMSIPIFMESNPFTGDPDHPIEARPTPFAILAPRIITDADEFHAMMRELEVVGNKMGVARLPYRYPRKGYFGKKLEVETIYEHSV